MNNEAAATNTERVPQANLQIKAALAEAVFFLYIRITGYFSAAM